MRSSLTHRRPSWAMLLAVLALFLAAGGSDAYATAANFLLNTGNTGTAQTGLDGSAVAGNAALRVANTSSVAGSTALNLSVASGHPPSSVSAGSGRVTGLDADLVDRTNVLTNRLVVAMPSSGVAHRVLLTLPAAGELDVACDAANGARVSYKNTSPNTLQGWVSDSGNGWSEDPYPPGASVGAFGLEAELAFGFGVGSRARTVVVARTFSATEPAPSGTNCIFQAQATAWTG